MANSPDSDALSHGIRVQAAATYLPEESNPDAPFFLYMYRIGIRNEGFRRAKLLSRHWIIKDAFNEREDVRGPGVVGEYPVLAPGQSYEYASTSPLRTRWGTMEGSYRFEDCDTGETFKVEIGRFFLVPTSEVRQLSAET